jgi:putative endonuclease
MKYYSYVVYSRETGVFYYGYTDNLEKAIQMHDSNLIPPTKDKGPWTLMFTEEYDNRMGAIRQSRFYRSVKGQRFMKKMLNF